jgi:hypothetical protein
MKKIGLGLATASDIPILMKMLASPRADGQQRVICISPEQYLVQYAISGCCQEIHGQII